ncbi:Heat stress transcription factor A-9 [Sesamum alatum]|uniref:Heat stress transcription factor A-9 n=1 Tax=Sesamum alatum TaxID=300844 RepID=A0AAE1Z0K4_9LAMI|nr:Heat stress transcription factor A-9 [Sesamum alatum]
MDFETAQMVKDAETENAGRGDGEDVVVCNPGSGKQLEAKTTPFLRKTFEMVDDQETNSIISWNSTGTGFIIWDHNKFAAEILPRLFKSSNFSSFVYQLNNYGFKKISWDRYEYANGWFQAGKKHLLMNIKRRNKQSQVTKKRGCLTPDPDSTTAIIETKLDAMMTEQNDMKWKIQKLGEGLDKMEDQLTSLKTNTRLSAFEDEKMEIAVFLKQFMQYLREEKDEASGDNPKRPRSHTPPSTEREAELSDKVAISTEKLATSPDDSESSIQDKKVNKTREHAENCQLWKNMLEEDAGFDQEDLAAHHSKAILELEEMMASNIEMQREFLIPKPSDADVEDDGNLDLWT